MWLDLGAAPGGAGAPWPCTRARAINTGPYWVHENACSCKKSMIARLGGGRRPKLLVWVHQLMVLLLCSALFVVRNEFLVEMDHQMHRR